MDNNTARSRRPLWQWIAIVILLVGLLYAFLYYFWLNPQPKENTNDLKDTLATTTPTSPPSPSRPSESYVVNISKDGFSPQNLAIFPGDKITWQNKSGKDAQVASNPHPTHTDYSPLNLPTIKNNSEASLTFPEKGSYGYHDHLNPSRYGIIVVQ